MLDPAAELGVGQVALAQTVVLQWREPREAGQVQRCHRQLEHRDVRREPPSDVRRRDRLHQRVGVLAAQQAADGRGSCQVRICTRVPGCRARARDPPAVWRGSREGGAWTVVPATAQGPVPGWERALEQGVREDRSSPLLVRMILSVRLHSAEMRTAAVTLGVIRSVCFRRSEA